MSHASLSKQDILIRIAPHLPYAAVYDIVRDYVRISVENTVNLLFENKGKLMLRPLANLLPHEALALVKVAAPAVFGDYRYDPWVARLVDDSGPTYFIGRLNSLDRFEIDLRSGLIIFYYDGDAKVDAEIKPWYFTWYYENGFDVPGFPDDKTLHQLGLARYPGEKQ